MSTKKELKNIEVSLNIKRIKYLSFKKTDNAVNETLKKEKIERLNIDKIKFNNRNIKNKKITECIFSQCVFENIHFENCIFEQSQKKQCIFEDCIFKNCTFTNCIIGSSIFKNMQLIDNYIINSNCRDTIIINSHVDKLIIKDSDMRNFKIINSVIIELEFKDEFITKLDEESLFDIVNVDKKNYKKLITTYKNIKYELEINHLVNQAGTYYYKQKEIEYKDSKGTEKLKLGIYWLLCGYGEKPTYALITSIEIIAIFAVFYMLIGIKVDGEIINYNIFLLGEITNKELIYGFMQAFYFSIVTFTTVGYGDITPIGFSIALSGIEMLLGVTMVGVWTATLARKITR